MLSQLLKKRATNGVALTFSTSEGTAPLACAFGMWMVMMVMITKS